MNTTPTNPDTLTAQQYREAFQKVRERLTDKQLAMLRTHYHAPERKITARQMAESVGYPNFASVNLQYGAVGGLLCDILGQQDGSDRLFVLAHFIRPHPEGSAEWLWQMREPAAQALQELGWI
jgi:hypothetical protein